ncbi:hypothetical protein Leryth_022149 [Lithospermum erythrorhizon]|uniref:Oxidoreductase n=1 Tax=Lithospermum erythrorhizon TaxID=34254 RepID=A0AAV3QDS5_LITER|nr:hypothetical protein Leryth_022149 [Lithospermum erythrorhizon]
MDTINNLVAGNPVVIFSKSNCCISHIVVTLISSYGANPTVYNFDELPNSEAIEAALGRSSLPAVFIGQELIGSSNEVMSLHIKGKLVHLLKKAKAIWV